MYFENIIGQDFAKRYIINSLEKEKIGHAYIFDGIDGIGKTLFAKELSKILLKIENIQNATDFYEINPDGNSIKISQIRDLQNDIFIKPHGKYKIYLINESDKLTEQSQNALLKTLEEPPSYAVIILLTKNKESLLNTIKSRCEIVKFLPISQVDIEKFLKIKGIDNNNIKLISSFSKGSISKVLDLLDSETFFYMREDSKKYIEVLLNKNLFEIINLTDEIEKYKDDMVTFLDIFITYFVDIMSVKENVSKESIINIDSMIFISNMSSKISYSQVIKVIDIINDVVKKLNSNCNLSINMQILFLNIYEVIK